MPSVTYIDPPADKPLFVRKDVFEDYIPDINAAHNCLPLCFEPLADQIIASPLTASLLINLAAQPPVGGIFTIKPTNGQPPLAYTFVSGTPSNIYEVEIGATAADTVTNWALQLELQPYLSLYYSIGTVGTTLLNLASAGMDNMGSRFGLDYELSWIFTSGGVTAVGGQDPMLQSNYLVGLQVVEVGGIVGIAKCPDVLVQEYIKTPEFVGHLCTPPSIAFLACFDVQGAAKRGFYNRLPINCGEIAHTLRADMIKLLRFRSYAAWLDESGTVRDQTVEDLNTTAFADIALQPSEYQYVYDVMLAISNTLRVLTDFPAHTYVCADTCLSATFYCGLTQDSYGIFFHATRTNGSTFSGVVPGTDFPVTTGSPEYRNFVEFNFTLAQVATAIGEPLASIATMIFFFYSPYFNGPYRSLAARFDDCLRPPNVLSLQNGFYSVQNYGRRVGYAARASH